jgi:hypothetical protein
MSISSGLNFELSEFALSLIEMKLEQHLLESAAAVIGIGVISTQSEKIRESFWIQHLDYRFRDLRMTESALDVMEFVAIEVATRRPLSYSIAPEFESHLSEDLEITVEQTLFNTLPHKARAPFEAEQDAI